MESGGKEEIYIPFKIQHRELGGVSNTLMKAKANGPCLH